MDIFLTKWSVVNVGTLIFVEVWLMIWSGSFWLRISIIKETKTRFLKSGGSGVGTSHKKIVYP